MLPFSVKIWQAIFVWRKYFTFCQTPFWTLVTSNCGMVSPTFFRESKISLYYHLSSCGIQNRILYVTSNILKNSAFVYGTHWKGLQGIAIYILSKSNFTCNSILQPILYYLHFTHCFHVYCLVSKTNRCWWIDFIIPWKQSTNMPAWSSAII